MYRIVGRKDGMMDYDNIHAAAVMYPVKPHLSFTLTIKSNMPVFKK